MVFVPDFMAKSDEYLADKLRVKTLADWREFRTKWLDTSAWPARSKQQSAEGLKANSGPLRLGGREWGHSSFAYDLSAEARYEYMATMLSLGSPLKFPEEVGSRKVPEEGWSQDCPYCEIWTDEIGDELCPQCGRKLLYSRASD